MSLISNDDENFHDSGVQEPRIRNKDFMPIINTHNTDKKKATLSDYLITISMVLFLIGICLIKIIGSDLSAILMLPFLLAVFYTVIDSYIKGLKKKSLVAIFITVCIICFFVGIYINSKIAFIIMAVFVLIVLYKLLKVKESRSKLIKALKLIGFIILTSQIIMIICYFIINHLY